MEKEQEIYTKPRPEFSRFEVNLAKGSSLPIFPLTYPDGDQKGVVLVGDYIAQDFVKYLQRSDMSKRSKWLILTTTQSDAVPTDCVDVDFNFFTNQSEIKQYLTSPAANIPFSVKLGDAHYIDSNIFYPNKNCNKQWDIVYPAKWYPTKNTEILIEAAKLDPSLKIAIYGWPVISKRKIQQSILYRDKIIKLVKNVPNVDIFDTGFKEKQISHQNPDGTVVVGNLSKEEMRNKFYWQTRMSIFLSETTEAVNRACTEMLCCDVPMLIAPTKGGMEELVNSQTGVLIERSPLGIINGVKYLRQHTDQHDARNNFLKTYGKENSNKKLKEIVQKIATQKGVQVNWEKFTQYSGDLWTPQDIYNKIFNS